MAGLPQSSTYVNLITFRRTGEAVPTPVWAAPDGDRLVVCTRADSGKVKRLRHTARVTVAPCDVRGRTTGEPVEATAVLLEPHEWRQARAALARRYGWQWRVSYASSKLWQRVTRPGIQRHAMIRVRPA
ncbi:PPOX class F420-dependent oxidoreductase [Geodermatophilus sp. SYSU D01106]